MVLLGTASVLAAIPDSNGFINACYKNNGGALRVVDASTDCTNSETALDWRRDGGQIISNRINVAFGDANNQQVLNIPNLGEIRVSQCDSNGVAQVEYHNNTGQDVLLNGSVSPAGDLSNLPVLLGYISGDVNFVARVDAVGGTDGSTTCYFQAQATLSQN